MSPVFKAVCVKNSYTNENGKICYLSGFITVGNTYDLRQQEGSDSYLVLNPDDGLGPILVSGSMNMFVLNGFLNTKEKTSPANKKKCDCDIRNLMAVGCKCGGV